MVNLSPNPSTYVPHNDARWHGVFESAMACKKTEVVLCPKTPPQRFLSTLSINPSSKGFEPRSFAPLCVEYAKSEHEVSLGLGLRLSLGLILGQNTYSLIWSEK